MSIVGSNRLDAEPVPRGSSGGSRKGALETFSALDIAPPRQPHELDDDAMERTLDMFGYGQLIDEEHDEVAVRGAIAEMLRALAPGQSYTPVFRNGGSSGMSLSHVWFGPDFPLFRHAHPKLGDCLYFVVAGSIVMGSRILGPGDGFFVTRSMPYKYRAGPEGVQVLEFRADGGTAEGAACALEEPSIEGVRSITRAASALHEKWRTSEPPRRVGSTSES